MFRGDKATCNGCLAHRKKWAKNYPEKVRELSRKYGEEHKEEKKPYNQEYNRREVECEVCRCKVRQCNWLRHLETKKHRDGVEIWRGARGARRRSWTDHQALALLLYSPQSSYVLIKCRSCSLHRGLGWRSWCKNLAWYDTCTWKDKWCWAWHVKNQHFGKKTIQNPTLQVTLTIARCFPFDWDVCFMCNLLDAAKIMRTKGLVPTLSNVKKP